ncbi:helix-turn-helix domain-containing protein [Rhodococcus sp. 05-2254-4]|uniref:helix-turn-helix domain-containing protein n=1 Tax=Rhodococcus sp. 05-2254-4 TaxID=2022492 RepID=UPI0015950DF4|nr:helix-turn-helix domain-containing protein [Rhodococcus sp. 05-2254-4]
MIQRIDNGAVIISRHDAGLALIAIDALADARQPTPLHPSLHGLRNELEAAMMDPASADVNASRNARTQAAQMVSLSAVSKSAHDHEFDTREVAELLGCTTANVRDLRTRGKLPGRRHGGRWYFASGPVIAYASDRDR